MKHSPLHEGPRAPVSAPLGQATTGSRTRRAAFALAAAPLALATLTLFAPVRAHPAPSRPQALHVLIDVMPHVAPNVVDLTTRSAVPVAILSTAGFDATAVDAASVWVAGAPTTKTDDEQPASALDVNADGLTDLVVYFSPRYSHLTPGLNRAELTGATADGTLIEGSDDVSCVGGVAAGALANGLRPRGLSAFIRPDTSRVSWAARLILNLFGSLNPPARARTNVTQTHSNTTRVRIPGSATATSGVASPYPSNINVSGFAEADRISHLAVTLHDLNHTFPDDLDILLVGPAGQKFVLMSDRGGDVDLVDVTLTFDDGAAALVPAGAIAAGTYRPANEGAETLPAPAPSGPYLSPTPVSTATLSSAFNGSPPNGTWSLYVNDDRSQDTGSIDGGWSLTITTSPLDTTPPTTALSRQPAANGAGWNNTDVELSLTASDSESGVSALRYGVDDPSAPLAYGGPFTVTAQGQHTVYFRATDAAGNLEPLQSVAVWVDREAPALSASRTPAPNSFGWNNTEVTASYAASDALSGLDSPPAGTHLFSAEGVGHSHVFSVSDRAGNTSSVTVSDVNIDLTAPSVSLLSPAAATYFLGEALFADYSCADAGAAPSGLAACEGTAASGSPLGAGPVGPREFTVTAADRAGNTSSRSVLYALVYNFAGFFRPVENLPTINQARAGSAVPVKFRLGGYHGLNVFAPGFPFSVQASCDASGAVDEVTETVTAGSSGLGYDASADQYVYVWKTDKGWAGTCRQLVVRFDDGSERRAGFRFTK